MRQIDVVFRHNDVSNDLLEGKIAVVIDVLRATSVMITALANGASSVRTEAQIETALEIKKQNPDVILAGERNAIVLDGFDYGNSPLDMTKKNISAKDLVMCTSNGTKAVAAVQGAKKIWAAAFINLQEVVNQLLKEDLDILMVCSGTLGKFSLDDSWAAGILINKLMEQQVFKLTDSAQMTLKASNQNISLKEALKDCHHLNYLKSLGLEKDVDYCLSLDIINAVPKWNDDRFTL